jgi:hypothetical protein
VLRPYPSHGSWVRKAWWWLGWGYDRMAENENAVHGTWQVEDVERQALADVVYRGADGAPRAILMPDTMLLVGFVSPEDRSRIWEALCADIAVARRPARKPEAQGER